MSDISREELTFQEVAQLNDRKADLKASYSSYIHQHPEIRTILNDFICAALLDKPDDAFAFTQNHFANLQAEFRPKEAGTLHPLVVTGPNGAGKKTLMSRLHRVAPDHFEAPKLTVGREPIEALGENSSTALFVSPDRINADIDHDRLIFYARDSADAIYGMSYDAVEDVLASGKVPVIVLSLDAFKQLEASRRYPEMRTVFVRPHELEAIEERLKERGTDTMEQITASIHRAQEEVAYAKTAQFGRMVVNAVVESAFADLKDALVEWYPHTRKHFEATH